MKSQDKIIERLDKLIEDYTVNFKQLTDRERYEKTGCANALKWVLRR